MITGESASIERACKEKCLDIKFELISPRIPQRIKKSKESLRIFMGASDQC
jgi:hypothetical protein